MISFIEIKAINRHRFVYNHFQEKEFSRWNIFIFSYLISWIYFWISFILFIETEFSISKRRDNSSSYHRYKWYKYIIFTEVKKNFTSNILGKRIKHFSKSVTTLHRFVSAHYPSTSFFLLRFAIRLQDLFRLIYIRSIFWKKTLNVREIVRLFEVLLFFVLTLFREKINLFHS